MKTEKSWIVKQGFAFGVCCITVLAVLLAFQATGTAESSEMKVSRQTAFSLYQKHCLGCHDSVADPEKQGRTRDDWHLVVNIMHRYGLVMTPEDGDAIVDLLYALRKGMERDPG